MGEIDASIFVIGSPDMDAMLYKPLPAWHEVKHNYEIPFDEFFISMFHPVTTEFDKMDCYASAYIKALEESQLNFVAIYPNNDKGSDFILNKLKRLSKNSRFKIFPSIRFEAFLVLMKQSKAIVGNSSAGIREAPFYGIPTINVGTRQAGRTNNPDIINTTYKKEDIINGLMKAGSHKIACRVLFGDGKSDEKFMHIISQDVFWNIPKQKVFTDSNT